MLHLFPPSETDLSAGNRDTQSIAANMRTRAEAKAADPALKTITALKDYAETLAATLTPFVEPQDRKDADLREILLRQDELMTLVRDSGQSSRLRDEGITEKAIIRLAQRTAGDTDDLGQAWLELQNAMDIAVRVQHEGRVASNHGEFVDEVLKRVANLASAGDYAGASTAITAALAEEEAAHQARKARLLTSGVEVAMLDGNSATAAELLVQKADLEAGGEASLNDLRILQVSYYERGRDKGVALDLSIAIELANLTLPRSAIAEERGAVLNDLGTALATLGERESGTARLEEAVEAFRNALEEHTRDRVPLHWARTQGNLAILERAFFDKGKDPAHLDRAMTHANAAREVFTEAGAANIWR